LKISIQSGVVPSQSIHAVWFVARNSEITGSCARADLALVETFTRKTSETIAAARTDEPAARPDWPRRRRTRHRMRPAASRSNGRGRRWPAAPRVIVLVIMTPMPRTAG
jgi:hypothetical protein